MSEDLRVNDHGIGAPAASALAGTVGNAFALLARHGWWLACLLLFVAIVLPKTLQPMALRTHAFDTGIYTNIVWNTAHGRWFYTDLLAIPTPAGQMPGGNHMGDHFSPINAILSPLAWFLPPRHLVTGMCAVQGLAGAGAVVLVFSIVKDIFLPLARRLGQEGRLELLAAMAMSALFLFGKPFISAIWFEFHPSTMGMPFLAGLILCLRRGWNVRAVACAALLMCCKESALLAVAGVVVYAAMELRRWKAAGVLAAAGVLVGVLAFMIVMPWARNWIPWPKMERLGPWTDLPGKGRYLFFMLASVGFLPLFARRTLPIFLPGVLLNASVNFPQQYQIQFHYDDLNSVLLIVSAAHGLRAVCDFVARKFSTVRAARLVVSLIALSVVPLYFIRGTTGVTQLRRLTGSEPKFVAGRAASSNMAGLFDLPADVGIVTQEALLPNFAARHRVQLLAANHENPILQKGDLLVLCLDAGAGVRVVGNELPKESDAGIFIRWAGSIPQLAPRQITPPIYVWECTEDRPALPPIR
jgi:uncharacterized membrane protein